MGASFAFGPRVLLSLEALERTGLAGLGSRVKYQMLVRLPDGATPDELAAAAAVHQKRHRRSRVRRTRDRLRGAADAALGSRPGRAFPRSRGAALAAHRRDRGRPGGSRVAGGATRRHRRPARPRCASARGLRSLPRPDRAARAARERRRRGGGDPGGASRADHGLGSPARSRWWSVGSPSAMVRGIAPGSRRRAALRSATAGRRHAGAADPGSSPRCRAAAGQPGHGRRCCRWFVAGRDHRHRFGPVGSIAPGVAVRAGLVVATAVLAGRPISSFG